MKESLERYTHFTMSLIGGFFGGFAIINFCDAFGNAQTANMIHTVLAIVGNDFSSVFLRVTGIIIYFLSFALSFVLSKYTRVNRKYVSLFLNLTAVFLVAFLPESRSAIVCIYPIFFAMPFQWSVFGGADGFASSTIFSSNNFRQFATALTDYFCTKDGQAWKKAKFYAQTLLSYHLGVLCSAIGTLLFSKNSIFLLILPIMTATVLVFLRGDKKLLMKTQTANIS